MLDPLHEAIRESANAEVMAIFDLESIFPVHAERAHSKSDRIQSYFERGHPEYHRWSIPGLQHIEKCLEIAAFVANPRPEVFADKKKGNCGINADSVPGPNLSGFLCARRLIDRLSTCLRESITKQDSKLVHC